ncbi:unnamed protein product, partial [Ectocarpus sp. 4 AP-2014]
MWTRTPGLLAGTSIVLRSHTTWPTRSLFHFFLGYLVPVSHRTTRTTVKHEAKQK